MSYLRRCCATLLATGALALPQHASAQGVFLDDFVSNGTVRNALTSTPDLRRGTTTTVTIRKDLIDLVPFDQVHASPNLLVAGSISNGRVSDNGRDIGFIRFRLALGPTATVGATIDVAVGLIDHFKFRIVREGLIASVTFDPVPSTVQAGTLITMTATGSDLGTPTLSITGGCNAVTAVVSQSPTQFVARFTRSATGACATQLGPVDALIKSTASGDPDAYATSNGTQRFSFSYAPPPPVGGLVCVQLPSPGRPHITAPGGNTVLHYAATAVSPQNVTVAWDPTLQPGNQPAPNGQFDVVIISSPAGTPTKTTTTQQQVTGVSTAFRVPIGVDALVTVRAHNCGASAPADSLRFSTRTP